MNNCFSICHTSWITSGTKSDFIRGNMPTKAILCFFVCSEMNSTWLIISELANQCTRKVLFTCVVYTNTCYSLALGTVNPSYMKSKLSRVIIHSTWVHQRQCVLYSPRTKYLQKSKPNKIIKLFYGLTIEIVLILMSFMVVLLQP